MSFQPKPKAPSQPIKADGADGSNGAIHAKAASVPLPTDKELVLKMIPMPSDCNANGDIFGGWVMAHVDLAGSVLPARYTKNRMVTVAVKEFVFKQAVRVGDILSFFAAVTHVGTTSITVQVEVYAEHFLAQGVYAKVTEASLTYVAIGPTGKPHPINDAVVST